MITENIPEPDKNLIHKYLPPYCMYHTFIFYEKHLKLVKLKK